jgi:hypothetical protein
VALETVHPPIKRAGLNRPEDIRVDLPGVQFLVIDFDSGQTEHNTLSRIGAESDLGFGADEVLTGPGDSGGPMIVGQAIAGVHSFHERIAALDPTLDRSWGELSFATRVSYFRNFIETATGGTAVFVPEPASVAMIITAAMGALMQRCRFEL